MNTPNMKPPLKTLTLLLTLCALSVSALNVFAQNFVVTSDTTVSGTHYENNGANYAALTNSNTWTFTGSDVTLTGTAASGNGQDGARFTVGGTLNLFSGTISANRYGIQLNTSTAAVNDTIITTAGNSGAHAINASGTSTLTVTGGTITTTGSRSIGVRAENFVSVNLSGATVITVGDEAYAVGAYNNTTLNITGGAITATGSDGRGVRSQDSFATLTDTVLAATGTGEHSYGFHLAVTGTAILNNVKITARETALAVTGSASEHPVLIINGGSFVAGRNALTLGSDMDAAALITITGADLVAPLLINTDILEGNPNTAAAEIVITDSTLAGDIVGNASSTIAIDLNRSPLTGNITGNDHATIDVTLSGTGSTLLGDIAQNDEAAVTITIDHGATGSGGYHGGNLITGGDSEWTFDKNSHGNYGENNGTWNIGDYEVIFDNLTHSGTITINVNSDTGEGGSITITGTADGEGKVHIDTTGNGKADPNQVLPGKVTGDGTENWQWDPIDWGIDTIIKDGDHFIKQGTSPAGAVLNSSVA
ncbi:MAG: hypothetical protein LBK71_10760, partial [Verrucomicrobiales bacterium]|nr:hypothetical protein [Verrucomicrobiales bacterium]